MVLGQVAAIERLSLEVGAKDMAAGELRAALEAARKAAAQEQARLGEQLERQQAQMQELQNRLSLATSGASASEVSGLVGPIGVCQANSIMVPACVSILQILEAVGLVALLLFQG